MRHCAVAFVARVQAVAGIKARGHPGGMLRIAQRNIEVDHRIERAAAANPVVHPLAQGLLVALVVVAQRRTGQSALKWGQRGADHAQAARMGLCDQLAVARRQRI
ncbi:hypothetical protein D3C78_1575160 [compost metagenome]